MRERKLSSVLVVIFVLVATLVLLIFQYVSLASDADLPAQTVSISQKSEDQHAIPVKVEQAIVQEGDEENETFEKLPAEEFKLSCSDVSFISDAALEELAVYTELVAPRYANLESIAAYQKLSDEDLRARATKQDWGAAEERASRLYVQQQHFEEAEALLIDSATHGSLAALSDLASAYQIRFAFALHNKDFELAREHALTSMAWTEVVARTKQVFDLAAIQRKGFQRYFKQKTQDLDEGLKQHFKGIEAQARNRSDDLYQMILMKRLNAGTGDFNREPPEIMQRSIELSTLMEIYDIDKVEFEAEIMAKSVECGFVSKFKL